MWVRSGYLYYYPRGIQFNAKMSSLFFLKNKIFDVCRREWDNLLTPPLPYLGLGIYPQSIKGLNNFIALDSYGTSNQIYHRS